ncbi:DEAD/DEAH box helicase [Brevundimonas sp. TWP3-1-2b1]|uniref:DEAD/DEAH box helicase n=1 Tax=Brevundimonas sp. TWP3-1-2b1 TaxID=2804650 RepID=UPI003CF97BF2
MSVSLEFDAVEEVLVLKGADDALRRNPLFAAYLRQASGTVETSGDVFFPTSAEVLSSRYQALSKIFGRIGVGLTSSGHVSDALELVEAEERRFAVFSRHADDIWHGQIETDDFRNFVSVVEAACPGRTFYRKQLLSAFHLAFSQHACNFSVPGAGKTSIVYAAYAYLKALSPDDEKGVDRLLIVGPLSSFKAWEDEFEAIFLRRANSKRISGAVPITERTDHLRGIIPGSREVELTLTSYPTLVNNEEDFRVLLRRGGRVMMVLDEAHYVKSADGQQANAALRLAPLARSRVVLTGTPAPNGYEDLANLFKFLYPVRHIVGFPAATLRAMTDGAMPSAIDELKTRIRPYFTRIRKSDLGLPDMTEQRVPIAMADIHERIYRSLERKIVPQLRQELDRPEAPVRVRARLIRLRQASVNPELLLRPLDDEGVFDTGGTGDFTVGELEVAELIRSFDAMRDLSRLEICRELVGETLREQGKVLIWSYFLGNLELLRQAFLGSAPFVEVLTGATPVASGEPDEDPAEGTREAIIDGFHKTSGPAILIANPQAVGESISLHKACRSAIYFDRDFNAGRYIQSKDRIHRYNPSGGLPVTYYHLVAAGTVDDDIDARLIVKEQRLADLVDAEDIPLLTALGDTESTDDIRAILDAYERRKTR